MTTHDGTYASRTSRRRISQRRLALSAFALAAMGSLLGHPIVAVVLIPPSWVLAVIVVGRHWNSTRECRDRVALGIAALTITWPWIYFSLGIWPLVP